MAVRSLIAASVAVLLVKPVLSLAPIASATANPALTAEDELIATALAGAASGIATQVPKSTGESVLFGRPYKSRIPAMPRPRPGPAVLPAGAPPQAYNGNASLNFLCPIIETEAKLNRLPPAFLARLIWKESRFNPKAVSPKGAQGIAQFMPGTAAERGLLNPFDPAEAIPHSALYLRELRRIFGNIGLAAAAYNAGPNRVARWLSGADTLPLETSDFVLSITGRAAQDWISQTHQVADLTSEEAIDFQTACLRIGILEAKRPRVAHAAVWQPWGVQLSADFSQRRALNVYSRLKTRFGSVLPDREPMLVQARNLSRGANLLHAVRLGAPSRAEAQNICNRLRSAGAACVVVRN